MGVFKDFVEKTEKTIIQSTWKNHPDVILSFIEKTLMEEIQPFMVSDIKRSCKEKINLLNVFLETDKGKKELFEAQKYAAYLPDAFNKITDIMIIDWICTRMDLVKGLNREELDYLLGEIRRYKNFIWRKEMNTNL